MTGPNRPKGIRLKVDSNVKTLTRANTIGHIGRELADAAGVDRQAGDTILAVLRARVAKKVQILLFDKKYKSKESFVGSLTITVDWDLGALMLESGSGQSSFTIDPDRPVAGQVSEVLEKAKNYIDRKTEDLTVCNTSQFYWARDGRRDEMREILGGGTTRLSQLDLTLLNLANAHETLEVSSEELPEVTIALKLQR